MREMPRYRIRQCAVLGTGSRMDYHPGRFIYHREIFIFVNDVERDILRLERRGRLFGQVNIDLIRLADLVRRFRLALIDENVAVLDQTLQARSRPASNLF